MKSILGVIVACIALICAFSYYGQSASHRVHDLHEGTTEDEQYLESSDSDEEYSDEEYTLEDSLNEIRFADFHGADWADNEYT